jgi:hypothetical protein
LKRTLGYRNPTDPAIPADVIRELEAMRARKFPRESMTVIGSHLSHDLASLRNDFVGFGDIGGDAIREVGIEL